MFDSFVSPKDAVTATRMQQDDVQNLSMHGRLMVSSRKIFGSAHSRDSSYDIEQGASTVQYRLQAVAVSDILYS